MGSEVANGKAARLAFLSAASREDIVKLDRCIAIRVERTIGAVRGRAARGAPGVVPAALP
jgi:hypothetical protein